MSGAAARPPFTLSMAAGCFGFAAPFCSTEETRFYLNGVFVEPGKSGVVAVATDGHTLIALHDDTGHVARAAILQPGKGLAALCRRVPDAVLLAKARLEPKAEVPVWLADADALHSAATEGEPAGALSVIDGEFPTWRRVFPAAMPSGKPAPGLQVRFLDRFRGPAEWTRGGKAAPVAVLQDGDDPSVVAPGCVGRGKPWIGLIMPMRCDPPPRLPVWLGATGVAP